MARVRLENVSKIYETGRGAAVSDVSLDIADGEFVVLVGPSGCGKSTTLRMIAGLETVTSGRIQIGERNVTDVAPSDRDIAMVFQSYALYPHMTVRQNLAFALSLRRMPASEIEARVRKASSSLELDELLDRKPKQLSGGQRQRVAVGRAIVREPAVFLFDEPLSNLDAALRTQTRRQLAGLHRALSATMVYVTHDQVEAMTLGDRIVVMSAGRVQQVDTPARLYAHPDNRFVAGFIGSPAMNFFEGIIDLGARTLRIAGSDGVLPLSGALAPLMSLPDRSRTVVGVRSEHLHRISHEEHHDARGNESLGEIPVRVDLVELMGSEAYVHGTLSNGADTNGARKVGAPHAAAVVYRTSAREGVKAGDTVKLAAELDFAHPFDSISGKRLAT
ncbi:MAG: sn-glycerol-3-phosphate ABC transporter ATP-binding protein UgpC [Gemmatimonadaceae bacterium]